ncbi:MAG: hypothetical protein QG594_913 [Bacteroidota bacterium]|nr:hypothetical protein [Bacteroidota bacterium]
MTDVNLLVMRLDNSEKSSAENLMVYGDLV